MSPTLLQLHQNRGIAYKAYVADYKNENARYNLQRANMRLQIEQRLEDTLPIACNPAQRVAELQKYCQ